MTEDNSTYEIPMTITTLIIIIINTTYIHNFPIGEPTSFAVSLMMAVLGLIFFLPITLIEVAVIFPLVALFLHKKFNFFADI